jgi:hypothetical protein
VLNNGQPIKDAETWWNQRRPEILEDFRNNMYGRIPENTPKVTWEITVTDTNAAGGLAIKKTVIGHIDNSRYPAANPSAVKCQRPGADDCGRCGRSGRLRRTARRHARDGAGAATRQFFVSTSRYRLGLRDDGSWPDPE